MRLIYSLLVFGLALGLGTGSGNAQDQKHPKSATTKGTNNRGEANAKDENIKHDSAPNDPNAKIEAPPEKGGPKTRSGACRFHVDNRTAYVISIYTDGDYRGQVSAFGDSYGWVGCGNTTFYAKALFTESARSWGPNLYYVDGTFTWTLTW